MTTKTAMTKSNYHTSHLNRNGCCLFLAIVNLLLLRCDNVSAFSRVRSPVFTDQNSDYLVPPLHPNHHTFQAQMYDGQNERDALQSTKNKDGKHAKHIILELASDHSEQMIAADLYLNTNLLLDDHFIRYQHPNGGEIVKRYGKDNAELCHYQGRIRGEPGSNVVMSTCDGLRGIINGHDFASIRQAHARQFEGDLTRKMEFLIANNGMKNIRQRSKRSSEMVVIEPHNSKVNVSYVEMVLVIDNGVYKRKESDLNLVHGYCKDIVNYLNLLYAPLNVFIALVGVVVWTQKDEIEFSKDANETLNNFLAYRRRALVTEHPNDNAFLITTQIFDDGNVGRAYVGSICSYQSSGGVVTDHNQGMSVLATTLAHELGHNFGMEHEGDKCKCVDEECIMSTKSSPNPPVHWSDCSVDELNVAVNRGMNFCLRNVPKTLFDGPVCGNGFVEVGEECDCGLAKSCANTCCDSSTCKLHSNAICATGKCCDLDECRPRHAGTVCRQAIGECDLAEYCNGESEHCPMDYFKRDAEVCDNGAAICYRGMCRTHDTQCRLLWGSDTKSTEKCYKHNLNGTVHGNCGYDRINDSYAKCPEEHILCGLLQCQHTNRGLQFGSSNTGISILEHAFTPEGDGTCATAIIDFGVDTVDPGLTPDGVKCGEGKVCIGQRCSVIELIRCDVKDSPKNCSGRGICNDRGRCHCDVGFAPPYCDLLGPGGSLDSGPGEGNYRIVVVLRDLLLSFVTFSTISLLLLYCKQNRSKSIAQTLIDPMNASQFIHPAHEQPPELPATQVSASEGRVRLGRSQSMRCADSISDQLKRMVPAFASMRLPAKSKRIWSVCDGPTFSKMSSTSQDICVHYREDSGTTDVESHRPDEAVGVAKQRW